MKALATRIRALLAEYRTLHDGRSPWRSAWVDGAVAAVIAVDVVAFATIFGGHS